jgi:hypothetical protein
MLYTLYCIIYSLEIWSHFETIGLETSYPYKSYDL